MKALGLLLLAACEAKLGSVREPADSVPPPEDSAPAPDTQPVCIKRPLYLEFGGVTLNDGATSDATQNIASWMTIPTATTPPYRANTADRAAQIQSIVDEVTTRLAGFTTVTTTRPPNGEYMMIVFGGSAAAVGSNFGFVQELDCGDNVRNDVAWADDTFPLTLIPNAVVGSIGFGIGLTATADPTDCMCSWDNDCRHNTLNCVLHDGIARDPTANQQCAGAPAIQDEIVEFNSAFCN